MQIYLRSESILLSLAPSITAMIANYLQLATQEFYTNLPHDGESSDSPRNWSSRSLLRRVPTSQYQYVSPIAHRLAAKFRSTPLEICRILQVQMRSCQELDGTTDCLEIYCWYNDAGYLYFQLPDRSILMWLNYLHELPLGELLLPQLGSPITDLSLAIYAHTRCCAVLELARAERLALISTNWQLVSSDWQLIWRSVTESDSDPLKNGLRTHLKQIFEEPAEQMIIHTLMDVLDGIYCITEPKQSDRAFIARLAIDLAQSWLDFHRDCRIFGEIQRQNPHLAIARCGLTAIVRRYLVMILGDCLGVAAPQQL